jgi:exodeoxyribonuclease III
MRITSWNINGLRAALRKRFAAHLRALAPDVLMLQEIRCEPDQLPARWRRRRGWHVHWHPAERKGYSGVATWSRCPSEIVATGLGGPDPDGRVLHVRAGDIHFVNVYLPSGARLKRQAQKEAWMKRLLPWAAQLAALREPVVLAGDLNIAHTERDIHDPRANAQCSGFLPSEREWFTQLLTHGWTDLGRTCWGDRQGPYTWWSNIGRARAEDRGWRLDYVLGNSAAARRCRHVSVLRQGGLDTSDHAPVTVEIA